jgi:hypothetical protein
LDEETTAGFSVLFVDGCDLASGDEVVGLMVGQ